MALDPNTIQGKVQARFHCLTSTRKKQMARTSSVAPAANSTYELVHSFLLMGNHRAENFPSAIPQRAATSSHVAFFCSEALALSHKPVSTPRKAVASEGMLLSSPSGSRTPS